MIEAGKLYRGEFGSRRAVLSIDGDALTYRERLGQRVVTTTVTAFAQWCEMEPVEPEHDEVVAQPAEEN